MLKENVTEDDRTEIKNASKKMDAALATISTLSELSGSQLGDKKYTENRRKLNFMMKDLDISR
jgi:hypothetical protein